MVFWRVMAYVMMGGLVSGTALTSLVRTVLTFRIKEPEIVEARTA